MNTDTRVEPPVFIKPKCGWAISSGRVHGLAVCEWVMAAMGLNSVTDWAVTHYVREGERTPKWRGGGRGSNNKLVVVCYSPPLPRWRSYLGHLRGPVVLWRLEGGDWVQLATSLSITLNNVQKGYLTPNALCNFISLLWTPWTCICVIGCGFVSTKITLSG